MARYDTFQIPIHRIVRLLVLLWWMPLSGQTTGYIDTFDGALKMSEHAYFSYHQANGVLEVQVNVPQGVTGQGFTYTLGEAVDLAVQPALNLRLKSDFSFLLSVYVFDIAGLYKQVPVKIEASDTFLDYYIDFGTLTSLFSTDIVSLRFTPNGNTTDGVTGMIYFEEMRIGTEATKMAAIGGMTEKSFFINSQANRLKIIDLDNATAISASGALSSLTNISVTEISEGYATVEFDCQPSFSGRDTLEVTAIASEGYTDNHLRVPILIEENKPPSIDPIQDISVQAGDTILVKLTGIDDGNKTASQTVQFTINSSNQEVLPDSNLFLSYQPRATVGLLRLIPVQAATKVTVTLTLDDGFGTDNLFQRSFFVDIFQALNHAPTIHSVPDQHVLFGQSDNRIILTGISDGDQGIQNLSFSVASSDSNILPLQNISITYEPGASQAFFDYLPVNTGQTQITLTLTDDGGDANNNGDAQTQITFSITSAPVPPAGTEVPVEAFGSQHIDRLTAPGDWNVEGYQSTQFPEVGTFQGRDNVLKITFSGKTCWTGVWYQSAELDISEHRYLSYDIYFEGSDFQNGGQTHAYLWDVNDLRNLPRAHQQRKTVSDDRWATVFMDFRGSGGMSTDEGEQLNVQRINRILINYASGFSFPFPVNQGTVYLTNIKIGSAVPDSLVTPLQPLCTIDPVADQTVYTGSGEHKIELSSIGSGAVNGAEITITATSDNIDFMPHPTVTAVSGEGRAELTYQTGSVAGRATITISVQAQGSVTASTSFVVDVVDKNTTDIVPLTIDPSVAYQTMRGFGTFQFSDQQNYIDFYTHDLGASAVRIGLINNQIEPVNDNEDPEVLDMTALNYSAFDFNYYRQLKENGVETFILTSWSPPAWMKRNLSVSYGQAAAPNYSETDNILEPYYFDEFAESMVAVVKAFRDRADIDLYAIGPQNEPAFNEPYPSAVLSPLKFAELIPFIGDRFSAENIDTKIYMPEQVFSQYHYSMAEYINVLKTVTSADFYTDVIATHSYTEDGIGEANPTYPDWTTLWTASQSTDYPKELWMSETYPVYQTWDDALSLAGAIHGALAYGNISLWTLWSIEGTLMDKGEPTASFYTSKNYYKFIRPGAKRIEIYEDHNDILATSFIDLKNDYLTAVLINKSSQPLKISVFGDSIPARFDMYITAEYINFAYDGTYSAAEMIVLPAKSVSTLVGSLSGDIYVSIEDPPVAKEYQLYQNYPNPFNPQTTIRFSLARSIHTKIVIYNVLGQKVYTLADRNFPPGMHQLIWDGRNDGGNLVASGIYFYRLSSDAFTRVKKCILIR